MCSLFPKYAYAWSYNRLTESFTNHAVSSCGFAINLFPLHGCYFDVRGLEQPSSTTAIRLCWYTQAQYDWLQQWFYFRYSVPINYICYSEIYAGSTALVYQWCYNQYPTDNLFLLKCAACSDSVSNMWMQCVQAQYQTCHLPACPHTSLHV